ncbi:hypothetical protein HIM_07036 [Hirsutella minnesotensis 3608]|uniref:Uncharacterized protein n=1 Tax=Hirsutella minnesotensis 3608 TaxID=1043627 RepID=A0A0F7ZNB9_9HYPO|nr:hypothetical protein HIM_07036 [Hirsutella minnesotensis 3608]
MTAAAAAGCFCLFCRRRQGGSGGGTDYNGDECVFVGVGVVGVDVDVDVDVVDKVMATARNGRQTGRRKEGGSGVGWIDAGAVMRRYRARPKWLLATRTAEGDARLTRKQGNKE